MSDNYQSMLMMGFRNHLVNVDILKGLENVFNSGKLFLKTIGTNEVNLWYCTRGRGRFCFHFHNRRKR